MTRCATEYGAWNLDSKVAMIVLKVVVDVKATDTIVRMGIGARIRRVVTDEMNVMTIGIVTAIVMTELRKMCPNTDVKGGAKRGASSSSGGGHRDKRDRKS